MSPRDRFHALDAARAFALVAGIVLHATMSFFLPVPAADVSSSAALAVVFYAIHPWRMSLFFLIAGFFAHLAFHRRGARAFVADRAKRIGVPLVGGWLLLAPATIAIVLWGLARTSAELSAAGAAAPDAPRGLPLTHLWFLYYLLLLYALALLARQALVALVDRYGGSMPSGWTRWLLEQFEFPFEVVYPQALDAGNLNARFDVLVFVDGAIPERDAAQGQGGGGFFGAQPAADTIPEEFRGWLGRVTVAKTVPQLKTFVEQGGTILTIGSSTSLAAHLGLPISSALVEASTSGFKPLPQEKFYIPGSILRTAVDASHPLAHGMPPQADVFFDHSPAFRLGPDAAIRGVKAVAWFDSPAPLRSGWAWGQHYLHGAAAVVDASVGKGRLVLFGPEVLFRGQPHGTFKLFFNGLYLGGVSAPAQTTKR